jgi:hypothetical protein
MCYDICTVHKWAGLADEASRDLGDKEGVGLPCLPIDETLGKCARRYLASLKRERK